jgi:PadR family transcriptional regulator PadR
MQLQTGKLNRRLYRITSQGRRALTGAKRKVRELFGELFHEAKKENRS